MCPRNSSIAQPHSGDHREYIQAAYPRFSTRRSAAHTRSRAQGSGIHPQPLRPIGRGPCCAASLQTDRGAARTKFAHPGRTTGRADHGQCREPLRILRGGAFLPRAQHGQGSGGCHLRFARRAAVDQCQTGCVDCLHQSSRAQTRSTCRLAVAQGISLQPVTRRNRRWKSCWALR